MWRALLFVGFTSCGAVSFVVEQALDRQDLQGTGVDLPLPNFLPNPQKFTIDIKAEVQKRGTGPATKAFLKSLTLTIAPNTPNENFDFMDEVHLFAEGASLPKVEIARLKPVPRGMKTLSFEVIPDIDLLPYINAGATISATATGKRPRNDTSFDGKVAVEVRI